MPVADSVLFDSLLHIPETLEKLIFPQTRDANGGGAHSAREEAGGGERNDGLGTPPVDILATPKAYTFLIDVPGTPKSDIQVNLEDERVLVIKSNGKRKREGEDEGCKYLRLERKAAPKFLRKFQLPDDANPSAITAKCENGVLTVIVEKLTPPPEPKTKTVEVTVA